jgi:membrane-associated phospholipid phosphatase
MVPHGTVAYTLARRPARFPRAAALTYAVFDIGAMIYWVLPTAPPWYAAEGAYELDGVPSVSRAPGRATQATIGELSEHAEGAAVRRMMVEYGEHFWRDGWGSLYSVFGGNPLAAMPSLHFATTLMAALLLAEVGPVPGALGFAYTATLGFALVYLGEHYVVDLLAGAALTVAVRRSERWAARPLRRIGNAIGALEGMAHQTG